MALYTNGETLFASSVGYSMKLRGCCCCDAENVLTLQRYLQTNGYSVRVTIPENSIGSTCTSGLCTPLAGTYTLPFFNYDLSYPYGIIFKDTFTMSVCGDTHDIEVLAYYASYYPHDGFATLGVWSVRTIRMDFYPLETFVAALEYALVVDESCWIVNTTMLELPPIAFYPGGAPDYCYTPGTGDGATLEFVQA